MPFNEVSIMDQRREFVLLSNCPRSNISGLCKEYGIDVSDLPAGLYFVRIQTERGTLSRKVVIK